MIGTIGTVLQQVTFDRFALHQWREASLLHRLLAPLRQWRLGSRLLPYGDAIAAALVSILFILAPFVSTALIGILLLICAAFWALLTLSDKAEGWLTPVHLGVTLYWGAMVLATALSPVKTAALSGLIKLTLNLLLFLLLARILRRPWLRTGLLTVYILTTLVVSVYGMRQWFFGAEALATWVDPESGLSGTTRVYSYLGNPNLLAAYLIPAVTLSAAALFVWPRWLPKLLAAMALALNTACLALTFSRGGWLGILAAGFVMLALLLYWWLQASGFGQRLSLPVMLGAGAGLVLIGLLLIAAAVLFVEPVRERVFSIFSGRQDSSNNFRLNVWAAVFDMIRDRPVTGIGPGNEAFNQVYPLFQRPRFTALSAYSIFLETLVEGGLVGFSAFLWMLGIGFYQGLKQLHGLARSRLTQGYWLIAAIAAQAGLLVHGLVDTVWYRPQVSILWWLTMAIIASFYRPTVVKAAKTA